MGTLRRTFNHTGMVVNGIALGDPAQNVNEGEPVGDFFWDDGRFSTGDMDEFGVITFDEGLI